MIKEKRGVGKEERTGPSRAVSAIIIGWGPEYRWLELRGKGYLKSCAGVSNRGGAKGGG